MGKVYLLVLDANEESLGLVKSVQRDQHTNDHNYTIGKTFELPKALAETFEGIANNDFVYICCKSGVIGNNKELIGGGIYVKLEKMSATVNYKLVERYGYKPMEKAYLSHRPFLEEQDYPTKLLLISE